MEFLSNTDCLHQGGLEDAMRLLVINANTSQGVTDLCCRAARMVAAPGTEIVGLTAEYGARIIENRAQNVVGAHAVLDMLGRNASDADAALIAVSYDTGLKAAQEMVPFPVLGMTQAALLTASLRGDRLGMLTFGTPHIYRELAVQYGMADRIAAIRTLPVEPGDAYANPSAVIDAVKAAGEALVSADGADSIVLCGAALAGMSLRLTPHFRVPVIDGIVTGTMLCEGLVRLGALRRL
ncbi:MAG: aspartate/glutamate racemase family protein [Microvirga sp.]